MVIELCKRTTVKLSAEERNVNVQKLLTVPSLDEVGARTSESAADRRSERTIDGAVKVRQWSDALRRTRCALRSSCLAKQHA